MKYNTVGRSGIQLSEIGLGCWAIGGPYWTNGEPTGWAGELDEDDIIRAINIAIDSGVNHFDTADVYGYGNSERLLARALGRRSHDVIVASKVGWAATTAPHVFDRHNIRHQCEQSLRNLNRDYIDIYYLHHCEFGENREYLEEAIATLAALSSEGKIREVGLSGYSYEEMAEVIPQLRPAVVQSWADIEHDEFIRVDAPLTKLLEQYGASFLGMMPFGQGRLLGKYDAHNPPTFGAGDNRQDNESFTSESLAELEPRLAAMRQRFGETTCDLARAALAFVLAHKQVAAVIPGFRTTEHVRCNVGNGDFSLSAEDLAFIHATFPRDEMRPHPWI